ncbi:pentapeptide repeat-containing protein [Enterococcus sp. LJL128]
MKEKKRILPVLPAKLPRHDLELEDEGIVEASFIENQLLTEIDFHHLFFKECHFKKLLLPGSRLRHFECVNVVFENCDFSNADWIGSSFHQVEFRGCKLTGINFAEGYFKDCLFDDCMLDYASFAASTLKVTHFEKNRLNQSDFTEVDWQHLKLTDCELTQSQWFHTKLNKLDLSENRFDAIAFSPESIRGLIINAEQALVIAGTLGVKIK